MVENVLDKIDRRRKEGRKGRKEGEKGGRREVGRKEGRKEGGRKEGRMKEGRKEGRRKEKKGVRCPIASVHPPQSTFHGSDTEFT